MTTETTKCTRCGEAHLHDNPEKNVIKHKEWTKKGGGRTFVGICYMCKSKFIEKDLIKKERYLKWIFNHSIEWLFCKQCKGINDNTDESHTPIGTMCKSCMDINNYHRDTAKERGAFHKDERKKQQKWTPFDRVIGYKIEKN